MQRKKTGFLMIMSALMISVCGFGTYSAIQVVNSAGAPFSPTVIIDAGHGGFDGGAVGAFDTVEKDINLAISQKLYDIAALSGFNVIMIRDSDVSVNDGGAVGLRAKKVSDIHNRLKIARQNPNAIYLSIHQNHFPQEKYWGTQVFYGQKNPESAAMAERIQRAVCGSLQPDNKRQIKPAEKNLYILYNAENPAVLVECGFISNEEECKRLLQPQYQQQLAFEIMRAVSQGFIAQEG